MDLTGLKGSVGLQSFTAASHGGSREESVPGLL